MDLHNSIWATTLGVCFRLSDRSWNMVEIMSTFDRYSTGAMSVFRNTHNTHTHTHIYMHIYHYT